MYYTYVLQTQRPLTIGIKYGTFGFMGRKRYMGFIFITYAGDHPPYHVHILNENGRNIGRFDIAHQQPMDDFKITKRLKIALIHLGYMKRMQT